jgi:hypothetical protein
MKHPILKLRERSVPLVAFDTADPAATIAGCVEALNGKGKDVPLWQWDLAAGWVGLNDTGRRSLADWYDPAAMGFVESLVKAAEKSPKGTVAFVHNPQRVWDKDGVAQAVWNLRDAWKTRGAMLVMVGPAAPLPMELQQDVVGVADPLPDAEAVGAIADRVLAACEQGGANVKDFPRAKAIDVLLGGSAFACEQNLFLAMGAKGLDLDALWQLKRRMIEQTPGLQVWRGAESFDSLGGLGNIKAFLTRILQSGRNPVRAIGFIDEIEKLFAASGSDLSGVSQDQLRVFLTAMQDQNIPGLILIGPPGTGKSAIAKAAGSVAGAEVLAIDTGAMTGSLVGESQAKIRRALDVFKAVSQGKGLFIATCNKLASLPPELRRRFTLGTFFVDLPSREERKTIWPIWLERYGLKDKTRTLPDDADWTGAEIRACCDVAFRADMSLVEAAQFVVPVAKSAPDQIETLRKLASGRFISANNPGVYQYRPEVRSGRNVEFS